MTSFKIIDGKSCHPPVKIEHKGFWSIKALNRDVKFFREKRNLQLNKLEELRLYAYENPRLYKE